MIGLGRQEILSEAYSVLALAGQGQSSLLHFSKQPAVYYHKVIYSRAHIFT